MAVPEQLRDYMAGILSGTLLAQGYSPEAVAEAMAEAEDDIAYLIRKADRAARIATEEAGEPQGRDGLTDDERDALMWLMYDPLARVPEIAANLGWTEGRAMGALQGLTIKGYWNGLEIIRGCGE